MSDIIIEKMNETYIKVHAEEYILRELQDKFSFYADGYKFHPKFKARLWNGKIMLLRVVSRNVGIIYFGLLHQVINFAKKGEYTYELNNLAYSDIPTEDDLKQYLKKLKPASKGQELIPRSYQEMGFIDAIQRKRQLLLSVTACLDPSSEIKCNITPEGFDFLKKLRSQN